MEIFAEEVSLLRSIICLSSEISNFASQWTLLPQRRRARSIARRAKVLSLIFEDILFCDASLLVKFSQSAVLWLREIFDVLQRLKKLTVKCFVRMSRVSLILRLESIARAFDLLNRRLYSLLGVFPLSSLGCGGDLSDLVELLQKQSRRSSADPEDEQLRREVLGMISDVERRTSVDDFKLENLFQRLGVNDSRKLGDEIERLELEIGNRLNAKRASIVIPLLGLLRYGKCILFGELTSSFDFPKDHGVCESSDVSIPADFRCPISLGLMRDPVVVSSGQTYDRDSINGWINSGHATCPKTAQPLSHSLLVPNRALRNIIHLWCRENGIPFDKDCVDHFPISDAQLEAAKTTIMLLVRKLQASPSASVANKIVSELRLMTKSSSENRTSVAEAGAVPLLVSLLDTEEALLQVNAITSLLNLSILPANKKRIMLAAGGLYSLVQLLGSGATWLAKETAAATLLSISSHHTLYRKKIAMTHGVAEGLSELVKLGPATSQIDGLLTMLQLAGDKDNISRLVDGGALTAALEATAVPDAAEIALAVVAAVAKRGGAAAVAGTKDSVSCLAGAMKRGTDRARETAAAALVLVCSHGDGDAAAELATISGVDSALWKLMLSGSEHGRMTAASLCRMCHR